MIKVTGLSGSSSFPVPSCDWFVGELVRMMDRPIRKYVGWGGFRAFLPFRLRLLVARAPGVAVLCVWLTLSMGMGSGSTGVLVVRATEMLLGIWYPAFARGMETP